MEKTTPSFSILSTFLIILSCFVIQTLSSKPMLITQTEALTNLYNAKLKINSKIDKSHFNAASANSNNHHHRRELLIESLSSSEMGYLKEKDRIEKLPGQPNDVGFEQYGGYVNVNESAGRAFYYYFVEADQGKFKKKRKKNDLPLLLWLNGGPGCSSLAYGAMQELGPFRVHSDGKSLYKNRYSWNHAANVLYLESPAGVGFSYSNTTEDFDKGGDKRTASDNYVFLLNWLERFPEYKGRDFYISGESYAGHYVPQLAQTILHHNKKAKKTIINLKGIIIGNAVIDDEADMKGMYDYFATHALISDETAYQIKKYCDFSPHVTSQSRLCDVATTDAERNINSIDIYNIYAPLCSNFSLTNKPKKISSKDFDPCSDYYVYAYLNRPDVQKALNANVTNLSYEWQPCSTVIGVWEDSPTTIIPLIKEFLANGIPVWIFSGDIDGRVPVTSTKYSIQKMKLKVQTPWHPWFLKGEVGGYTQVYDGNLTFATVRGAGHQVPSYQPARALSLIMHFLGGTELPDSSRH